VRCKARQALTAARLIAEALKGVENHELIAGFQGA